MKQALLTCALALIVLSGCAKSSKLTPIKIAAVPTDLQVCFGSLTAFPDVSQMTEADVIRLVGKLRKSEVKKARCGKRLLRWIESQREITDAIAKELR